MKKGKTINGAAAVPRTSVLSLLEGLANGLVELTNVAVQGTEIVEPRRGQEGQVRPQLRVHYLSQVEETTMELHSGAPISGGRGRGVQLAFK